MLGVIQDVSGINSMPKTRKWVLGVMGQMSKAGVPKNDVRYKLSRGKGAPQQKETILQKRDIILVSFRVKQGLVVILTCMRMVASHVHSISEAFSA